MEGRYPCSPGVEIAELQLASVVEVAVATALPNAIV